ncbi:hypothetical protein BD289DRAFT_356630, partial [Coniella lustricola]
MPPRRSHKKSRAGCKRCKARKIKCDEIHPRCSNCLKHGVACDFENPQVFRELDSAARSSSRSTAGSASAATPRLAATHAISRQSSHAPSSPASSVAMLGPPIYQQPGVFLPGSQPVGRLTELRLMHQYTRHTYKTLAWTSQELAELWGTSIPDIALSGNQHLVDAILAVSALHLRSAWPNDKDLVRASHAYMASCLSAYSSNLNAGIRADNAAILFLTSALIAFQSTALRMLTKDEGPFADASGNASTTYQPPLTLFHSFQGVKTVVAASWQWIKDNPIILTIIDGQPSVTLYLDRAADGFFGHLLFDLDEELAALEPRDAAARPTRQAYHHAVAMLNWAHARPGKAALAFPATVSRRFVELVEERQPRALAILACFFGLLKVLEHVWWLYSVTRREVLAIVSLFNSDFYGPDVERKWWPHLQWAVRIALYDPSQSGHNYIPEEIWGSSQAFEEEAAAANTELKFTSHIDILNESVN